MKPELINGHRATFFELIGPFTAVFVLGVFPFRTDATFEEVVV